MKKSSPINLEFMIFASVKTKITLLFSGTHFMFSRKQLKQSKNSNKQNNQNICEKVKFDKDFKLIGEDIIMPSAIVIPRFSTICG